MGKPLTMNERRTIQRMAREGYTASEIVKATGQARSTVTDIAPLCKGKQGPKADPRIPEQERIKDTRTFTQRFFGDPLPGRSALDQKLGVSSQVEHNI